MSRRTRKRSKKGSRKISTRSSAQSSSSGAKAPSIEADRRASPAAMVLALVLATGLVYQSVRIVAQLSASRTLFEAEELGIAMVQTGRGNSFLVERMVGRLQVAGARAPWDPRIPLAAGGLSMIDGDVNAAVDAYRRAIAIEPRPEIYFNLGHALLALGEPDEALTAFGAAVRLDPGRRADVPAALRRRL